MHAHVFDEVSFDVTCYYDSTPIGTLRVYNLPPGSSKILTFAWDTTGVAPGTYVVKAKVDSSIEIDESDETNNECTSTTTLTITAPAPPPPPPVGGVWVPINKFDLLAPYVGLVSLIAVVAVSVVYVRHRGKNKPQRVY